MMLFRMFPMSFLLAGLFVVQNTLAENLTVLKCGALLDVIRQETLKPAMILIKDERIADVDTTLPVPADALFIDLSEQTCLPGLMDMHYHPMAVNGTESMYIKPRSSAEYALVGASDVAKMLQLGYTTLRVPGHPRDPDYALIDLRNTINDGLLPGPRLFVAPHMLIPETFVGKRKAELLKKLAITEDGAEKEELQLTLTMMEISQKAMVDHWVAPGSEGVREGVRREIEHGADWIKIHLDGGGQYGRPITPLLFSTEELEALVDETHRLGKRFVVGAHGDKASLAAALAGADSVEHGFYISESTAQTMKEKGVYLVPTVTIFNDWVYILENEDSPELDNFERLALPGMKRASKAIYAEDKARNASFRNAYKIGVKMANGSDGFTPALALREFTYLAELGVSHWDIIRMATINSADLLGETEHLGSITPGKYADIIATPENPLDRIEALQQVKFVMKGGEVIRLDR